MKAIQISEYGSTETLTPVDVPTPHIESNEVLIKVHAAGVNPIDWKVREGLYKDVMPFDMPLILGWDIAGTIEAVGSKVDSFKPGDAVFGMLNFPEQGAGYSEYVRANPNHIWHTPNDFSMEQSAATPLAALTAWQILFDVAELSNNQSVLIHAGAGGVGHMAIQFAKSIGATVYTTCSEKNEAFVRSLGADVAINYQQIDFSTQVKNLDVIIDAVGGEVVPRSIPCLKSGGKLVTIAAEITEELNSLAQDHRVELSRHLVHPSQAQLKKITELANQGLFKVDLTKSLPYTEVVEAHHLIEGRHTKGKMVLIF